ncbi:MAG: nucleotidyltransferase domain-containing protein [Anaerolineae bacterium]|nr:nucleotidyltransferase domain-containing protein [Anaerolineae bacterium]MCX8066578.1 nucleotidyltransferase domain-containing protein [Anaerolineae bacterium]MDW7992476.1 nucleotidyltransferase domain-containing protein [Anaerolineae bacterium]
MPEPSFSSFGNTWPDVPQRASVERFLQQVRRLDPLLMVLFGSLATGDYTQYSDADVLVVFPKPVDWETVYACSDGVVQPVVVTWEELVARLEAGEPFFHEILAEGIPLLQASDTLWGELTHRAAVAAQAHALARTPRGWRWRE